MSEGCLNLIEISQWLKYCVLIGYVNSLKGDSGIEIMQQTNDLTFDENVKIL